MEWFLTWRCYCRARGTCLSVLPSKASVASFSFSAGALASSNVWHLLQRHLSAENHVYLSEELQLKLALGTAKDLAANPAEQEVPWSQFL